jgi:hypothetical protein
MEEIIVKLDTKYRWMESNVRRHRRFEKIWETLLRMCTSSLIENPSSELQWF